MIDGKWRGTARTPLGGIEVLCDLHTQDGKLTGTLTDVKSGGAVDLFDGKARGEEFSFRTILKLPLGKTTLSVRGTVAGDAFRGEACAKGARFAFEGKRI